MVKRAECELDHSLPPGTMDKGEWCYNPISPYAIMAYTGTSVSFIFQCADVDWIESTQAKSQVQTFCEYSNEHLGCMIAVFCCGVNYIATMLG